MGSRGTQPVTLSQLKLLSFFGASGGDLIINGDNVEDDKDEIDEPRVPDAAELVTIQSTGIEVQHADR